MMMFEKKALYRELAVIVGLSVFLALVYNTFSGRGLPLIRTVPEKTAVADSVLFQSLRNRDSARIAELLNDTTKPKDVKVIAPLHERALRNPDSVARVAEAQKEEGIKIVTLEQVKRLMREGRAMLIDARASQDYEKAHIKGARNIPGLDPGAYFEQIITIPRDTLIVIYCNNPLCHLGHSLADFMKMLEFEQLYLYDDGWDGWEKAGLASDTTWTSKVRS